MGIEGTDTPPPPREEPERINLASVRSIEPVHRGSGDDATGNDQRRIDLSSVRSIEPVHRGSGDDATGNDQSRVELPKSTPGTQEGGGVADVGDPAAPSKDAPGPSADTEVAGKALGSSDISSPSGPDAPPNPATPDQEQAPTVTQFHDRMAAMTELGPARDSAQPLDSQIAEASAGAKEGWRAVLKGAESANTIVDTVKNVPDAVKLGTAVVAYVMDKFNEFSPQVTHFFENFRL